MNETVTQYPLHRFRAAGNPAFGQNIADMRFNCGWADGQPASDLRIFQPIHHQRQDVPLALRQVDGRVWEVDGWPRPGLPGKVRREFICRDILEPIANREARKEHKAFARSWRS